MDEDQGETTFRALIGLRGTFHAAGGAAYAGLVDAGEMVEPSSATALPGGGPHLVGAVMLGPFERRGSEHAVRVTFVRHDRVLALGAGFGTSQEASSFSLRLRMRVGRAFGVVRTAWAADALTDVLATHLPDAARPYPSVGRDGVGRSLLDFVAGHALDVPGIAPSKPGMSVAEVLDDGLEWIELLNHDAATAIGLPPAGATMTAYDGVAWAARDGATVPRMHVLASSGRFAGLGVVSPPDGRGPVVRVEGAHPSTPSYPEALRRLGSMTGLDLAVPADHGQGRHAADMARLGL